MELKRLGSYQEVDAQGYLAKIADASKIQPEWGGAVDALRNAYLANWGDTIHSIYIRGSLAKGWAVKGVSDIDSLVVFKKGVFDAADESGWWENLSGSLEHTFPFINGLELHRVSYEEASDASSINAFIIKLEAVCIHGDDLAGKLPGYKPGPDIAFQTRHFQTHFDLFLNDYPNEPEDEKADFLNWMLRRFLRLGMELVMAREKRYTRDLYLCYESFSEYYPEKKDKMYRALELAVNPVVSAESFAFVQDFGQWLADEAQSRCETA